MPAGEVNTPMELVGRWEDLVSRPEFRGHEVKITIIDQPAAVGQEDDWVEGVRWLARNGVQLARPADDSRESIYEDRG